MQCCSGRQDARSGRRALGADQPGTLIARNNLAGAYESAGRLGEAIPLYEQTLVDRERLLGADHSDTLGMRADLGRARAMAALPRTHRDSGPGRG